MEVFFHHSNMPTIKAIPPENQHIMDEAGIMEAFLVNGLVVGALKLRTLYRKKPNKSNCMTVTGCISAQGNPLDPIIVFRCKTAQQKWCPDDL